MTKGFFSISPVVLLGLLLFLGCSAVRGVRVVGLAPRLALDPVQPPKGFALAYYDLAPYDFPF